MKNYVSSVLYVFSVLLFLNSTASASDITLSGSVYFKCNFISGYMEKHGYVLIEKDIFFSNLKIDRYAAKEADVIIKNQDSAVLGTGTTDEKGKFSISVPEKFNYRVVIRFHDRELEKAVPYSDAQNITADMGYFDTEIVGSWITVPPLYYCYTCDLRYLETKKRL